MLQMILFSLSVCADAFAASFAYGAAGIRIPLRSALVIAGVGSGFLAAAVWGAGLLTGALDPALCAAAGAWLLIALGLFSLGGAALRGWLRRGGREREIRFQVAGVQVLAEICLDETRADRDNSRTLSPKEALLLAVPLSADSLGAGFGLGLFGARPLALLAVSLLLGLALIEGAHRLGSKLAGRFQGGLTWLSGAILVLLGALRLWM
ncbi:manganese efflux pump [Acetanaerobacterium sp. MSJ-12]|nr:manganese efflux pump [Bittarella massiliensis (ex Durand et al. 2017)]MBU5420851.1 manganese efflux pump [Acetanaerobacterium sp. MSJ-12]